MFAFLSFP